MHKPGKIKTSPESYRPITLANCLAKTLEKMINRRLKNYLETKNFYSPHQSSFRARHSTLDGLIRLEHAATMGITNKKICLAVMLDIQQAFDKVWHHGLMLKLKALGVVGKLPKFIQGMLFKRIIRVKVGNNLSNPKTLWC